MNQDWHEKRLKRLFHDLGSEDERKAPDFPKALQASLPRGRESGRRLPLWRLVAIAGIPVVAVVVALLLLTDHPTEPAAPEGDFTTLQPLPYRMTGAEAPSPTIKELDSLRRAASATYPRRRSAASRTHNSSIHLSQWRSPTDYLLSVPGSELLKSLPRIPDSSPGVTRSLIEKYHN